MPESTTWLAERVASLVPNLLPSGTAAASSCSSGLTCIAENTRCNATSASYEWAWYYCSPQFWGERPTGLCCTNL